METRPEEQPLTPSEQAEFEQLGKAFTCAHYEALERQLFLYAMVPGWIGDTFLQRPPTFPEPHA